MRIYARKHVNIKRRKYTLSKHCNQYIQLHACMHPSVIHWVMRVPAREVCFITCHH